jgi:PAS domain S-box-containing protein
MPANHAPPNAADQFLSGGGEMGALTRAKDWSATPLGPISQWPQSLRTTLSILLNSKFPMFLFWGPEQTCFYNDAYRVALGRDGKHPGILGGPGKEAWPEIWHIINPFIDQVMAGGEAIWREDQLIPIYRNGHLEDVYWTFSYSPVFDESGRPAGIFVTCSDTTDRVLTLKKTADSNARFQNMVAQAPVAICVLRGPDHIVEIANDRVCALWDKTPEKVMNKPIFEALPEVREQGLEALLDRVFTTGETFVASERPVNLLRNGKIETTYLNFVYEALREADGRISGIMVVATEVTDQVAARKKIEEAEERARLAIEASRLGIWDYNPLTEELSYDEGTKTMFEHPAGKPVVLESFWETMHPDDRESSRQKMLVALDPDSPENYYAEYRLLLAGNRIKWIQATGKAFFNEQNVPVRFSGTVLDITERRKAEEELRLTTERFRLLADSMPQFVWTADPAGNLTYFNRSVYEFSGLTPAEVADDGWLQIVHPHDRELNLKRWLHSIRTGEKFFLEHRFRRHDGVYRWQLSRAIPQHDEEGRIQMWVGTSTDVHDQKTFAQELEQQVVQRTKELEQSNEDLVKSNNELARFAYVASHDLQEPLRKIQTFSSRILEKEHANLSDSGREYFNRMQKAAGRMQTLIEDLLAYSRTNTAERKFETIALEKILDEIRDDFKDTIHEKKAVIEVKEVCEATIIPFQFRQMMNNLVSNALKFSQADVPPRIEIRSRIAAGQALSQETLSPDKNYCHITIADNGIGFEPQFSERIFVLFQKLHGKDEYEGTGIGLAIVKKIVENHEGFIVATGEPGAGARFDIYLPA